MPYNNSLNKNSVFAWTLIFISVLLIKVSPLLVVVVVVGLIIFSYFYLVLFIEVNAIHSLIQ